MASYSLEGTLVFTYNLVPTTFDVEGNIRLSGSDIFGVFHLVDTVVDQYVPIRATYDGNVVSATSKTFVFRKEVFGLPDDLVLSCDVLGTLGEPGTIAITGTNLLVTINYKSVDQDVSEGKTEEESLEVVADTFETVIPTRVNVKHDNFLNTAAVLGVTVLPEDTNQEIKTKILRAASETRNSTYTGLINAISQDLNLTKTQVLRITNRADYDGTSTTGVVEVDGGFIRLFTEKFSNEDYNLDLEVTIREGLSTISELADYINANSNAFSALVLSNETLAPKALMIQSNVKDVYTEILESTSHIKLENENLVPGSVRFSNSKVFKKEVVSQDELLDNGDFYIDTTNGVVLTVSMPELGDFVSYQYIEWPFELYASDVIIQQMNSRALHRHIFIQEDAIEPLTKDPTLQTLDGVLTNDGAELISELLVISKQTYWGK